MIRKLLNLLSSDYKVEENENGGKSYTVKAKSELDLEEVK